MYPASCCRKISTPSRAMMPKLCGGLSGTARPSNARLVRYQTMVAAMSPTSNTGVVASIFMLLKIPDDPDSMSSLESREPCARHTEQRDDCREHEVEQRQAPHIAGRHRRRHHRMVAEQPRVDAAFADERH